MPKKLKSKKFCFLDLNLLCLKPWGPHWKILHNKNFFGRKQKGVSQLVSQLDIVSAGVDLGGGQGAPPPPPNKILTNSLKIFSILFTILPIFFQFFKIFPIFSKVPPPTKILDPPLCVSYIVSQLDSESDS